MIDRQTDRRKKKRKKKEKRIFTKEKKIERNLLKKVLIQGKKKNKIK